MVRQVAQKQRRSDGDRDKKVHGLLRAGDSSFRS